MEHIVLLHGIGANNKTLKFLSDYLSSHNYTVHCWSYSVYNRSLVQVVEYIKELVELHFDENDHVHFVGHSLGGVVARVLLTHDLNIKHGRLVTLGSPHKGSILSNTFPLGKKLFSLFFGKQIVHDLSHNSTVVTFPSPSHVQIGSIAGSRQFHLADPVSWIASRILKEPHDGFISIDSTLIEGAEHLILDVDHCFMVLNKDVFYQVLFFIKNGFFDRDYLQSDNVFI